ncbi:MAG: sigma-54-dependent Fis family transcriptional regulator [Leptolyngbya sp. PLA1]|nr:sigma-54-dependent Fis family transcriptional regulator [Leptolyngbya sp. PLA1]
MSNVTRDQARAQVLIVEDEPDHADVMAESLRKPGHVCTVVTSAQEAAEELRGGSFDVIVTDLRMPASAGAVMPGGGAIAADGGDAGLHVLRAARTLQPAAETILVTAHGDVPTARAAFKQGAYDFIQKPLDLEVFRNLVNRAAETVLLRHQNSRLTEEVENAGFAGIVATSEPMRRVLRTIRTVAPSNIPVLITGESGTGKELLAAAVHRNSRRASGRYAPFNCAGQSDSLLEDALFGHVRGAFTGADKDRPGVFEYADAGTVFLDEIGDMPMPMQAKLLRVLENGEVVRLGSNEPRRVDVRFVSATNRDLRHLVQQGTFRDDLFFRINGTHVHVPALRERREDIPPLVALAVDRFANQLATSPAQAVVPSVSDGAMMRLTAYHWPGNIRQLFNVVQNTVVQCLGEGRPPGEAPVIELRHIPDEVRADSPADDDAPHAGASLAGTSLEHIEKRAIRETLRLTNGNREHAAKLLGIGERTLYRKLKDYGLR